MNNKNFGKKNNYKNSYFNKDDNFSTPKNVYIKKKYIFL